MTLLDSEKIAQIKDGADPEPVEAIARLLAACATVDQTKPLFESLEIEANKLGWPLDRDFAAVALQHYSAIASAKPVQLRMLSVAAGRAGWCASCATSGGEGISRSRHFNELEAILQKS
jgi:hypothetical protein